jgi:tRNA nucleotidyltransferase (CCA-adding enzyme)
MKKLNPKQINSLNQLLKQNPLIIQIVKSIAQNNAKAYLVGGAVRDLLLDIAVKDLDIEVHGLAPKELEKILSRFGPVSLVGKSYGVFRLHGLDADWSVPRSDASGRKPEVKIDPYMSLKDAFRRRDLTINAMGMDLTNFGLVDPFGGYNDLKNKILRATDAKLFLEDPLRFFRVMQFIGRFQMRPDDELNKICSEMRIKDVSIERIDQEFAKLFLKSNKPSLGIRWLKFINRLKEILPELYATIGVEQNPQWHPEGDVFEHTMQSLDAAVV